MTGKPGRPRKSNANAATEKTVTVNAGRANTVNTANGEEEKNTGSASLDDVSNTVLHDASPVADFLVHLEKERDVSPNTVKAYARDLHEFVVYLSAYYGGREW